MVPIAQLPLVHCCRALEAEVACIRAQLPMGAAVLNAELTEAVAKVGANKASPVLKCCRGLCEVHSGHVCCRGTSPACDVP